LSKVSAWEQPIYEVIILIVNLSVLALAIADATDADVPEVRDFFATIIIYCVLTFSMVAVFFLFMYLLTGLISAYQISKKVKGGGMVAWLHALVAPFESGGMTFADIEEEHIPNDNLIISNIEAKETPTTSQITKLNMSSHNISLIRQLSKRQRSKIVPIISLDMVRPEVGLYAKVNVESTPGSSHRDILDFEDSFKERVKLKRLTRKVVPIDPKDSPSSDSERKNNEESCLLEAKSSFLLSPKSTSSKDIQDD